MLIIAGWFSVAPETRDEVVRMHEDIVRRARGTPGCLDLAISADPLDSGRVNMFELWRSEEELESWRAVIKSPLAEGTILGGDAQKHQISSSGPPF